MSRKITGLEGFDISYSISRNLLEHESTIQTYHLYMICVLIHNERAASRFVGVSKTAETMKRSPTSELNDLTYTPKRREKTSKLCKICKTPEMHLHRLTVSEAAKLSKWYNLDLLSDYRVCCRHFVPHTNEVFSKKHRPALLKDATEFRTAAPTRKAPPQRILAPPPTPIGMCTA
jgi:hypothetical protein